MTTPKLVLAYARRYEPDWLVEELLENAGWVDGVVCLDERGRTDVLWSPRAERFAALQDLAADAGADWVLCVDPDERLERRAKQVIRGVARTRPRPGRPASYRLRMRELFAPDAYRVDGVWGRKTRRRLFHLASVRAGNVGYRPLLDVNLYHLKHIEPENRTLRRRVHEAANTWDNRGRGFAYLDDDAGMRLERIPPGRDYHPPYTRPYRFEVPLRLLAEEEGRG